MLGRLMRRWEDNLIMESKRNRIHKNADTIHFAQDRD